MSKLVIVVPEGRRYAGRALLLGEDGALRCGPLPVLATASGWAARRHDNPTRDWRRPYGHPPTGCFVVAGSLPPGVAPRAARLRRFGPLGALVLRPSAGDALAALNAGRSRFLLHGGPPDRSGRLRPTFGGLRFSDRDLAGLFRAINAAFTEGDPLSTVELGESAQPAERRGPRDEAGGLRPADAASGRGKSSMSLPASALVALGFGALGRRGARGASPRPNRRDFLGLALLMIGASGTTACGGGDDGPTEVPRFGQKPIGEGDAGGPGASGDAGDGGGPNGGYAGSGNGSDVGGGGVVGGDVVGGGEVGGDTTGGDEGSGG